MRFNELQQLFNYYKKEIELLGYSFIDFSPIQLELMESAKYYGFCKYQYKKSNKDNKYNCTIKINRFLLNNGTNDEIINTLIHELIHAIKYPNNNGHNKTWNNLSDIIGSKLGYKISRLAHYSSNTLKPAETYKYKVACCECGKVWKFKRMCNTVKHPENWTCNCNGTLKRIL